MNVSQPPPPQVIATPEAIDLIQALRQRHGPLVFHQSGGCCEGSAPICHAEADFFVGGNDILLGEIGGAAFYVSAAQFGYLKHSQLIIDVIDGDSGSFSLDNGSGRSFILRSRLFDDTEFQQLLDAGKVTAAS
ncbi:DUF779 domain-containing protein [Frateuria aurantia]